MLYNAIKYLIQIGRIEGLATKIDTFYQKGELKQDEYNELIMLVTLHD